MRIKRIYDNLIKVHHKYLKASNKNEFLATLPTYQKFQEIMEDVDNLEIEEIGMQGPDDPYFFVQNDDPKFESAKKIRVTEIVDNENYAILMFFLKKGASLPLHDHEDMIIYSKVLTGEIKYRAMDKIDINSYSKNTKSLFQYY